MAVRRTVCYNECRKKSESPFLNIFLYEVKSMDARLSDVLNGRESNYLLPFYWQHGDHYDLIPEQIQRIYDSGCRALCVESRPHPDFCGETWWRDMDRILEEAKKRGMQVWLLDDDKFPTGHAAGMVAKKYPHLRQRLLVEFHVDVVGPAADTSVIADLWDPEDELIGAYAYRRNADPLETCDYAAIDLTDKVKGHYLTWDVPEGVWRIFFYYRSRRGRKGDYIDMINPESVDVLLEAVYESHWAHYKEYFGHTFVGFFSDEPCFGNQVFGKERFDFGFYEAKIGKHSLALPWNETVRTRMQEKLGFDPLPHLNLLWYEDDRDGDDQAEIRFAYMDTITQLYSECFNRRLGDWCRAHGVMYIGHIIEDMNCHMRGGVGHYFRALRWQDMSGIDIVLHQVMPGMEGCIHTVTCATGTGDGAFYHYILAKLGASLAHLTPAMQGRAMCEVFGAYGWGEDTAMMKYLMDHLLVRGINHFVPHAFSSKFPDPDCPPHFGAEGHDPSFEGFAALMAYTNKAAHLLYGTTHKANAAILYHMEGEWASRFDSAMNMQPAATRLYDAHIDYDIVCMDMLADARVEAQRLCIAQEQFDCLIVPYADHMAEEQLSQLERLHNAGVPVWFLGALPENAAFDGVAILPDEIVPRMKSCGMVDVRVEGDYPHLRIYHGVREGQDVFMFANEDYARAVDTVVQLPCSGDYARLDLLTDINVSGHCESGALALRLEPNQSQIVIFGDRAGLPDEWTLTDGEEITPAFDLELASCDDLKRFEPAGHFDHFFNVNGPAFRPDFSGKMRYTFTFSMQKTADRVYLDLGRVGQNAALRLNGIDCGIRISRPYLFDVTDALREGENRAEVVVSNTLAQKVRDSFSRYLQLAPAGLLGGMKIRRAR